MGSPMREYQGQAANRPRTLPQVRHNPDLLPVRRSKCANKGKTLNRTVRHKTDGLVL